MRAEITIAVDVPDEAAAAAARDAAAAHLKAAGVQVASESSAITDRLRQFVVSGVDVGTGEAFTSVVEAETAGEAGAAAATDSKIVAHVEEQLEPGEAAGAGPGPRAEDDTK